MKKFLAAFLALGLLASAGAATSALAASTAAYQQGGTGFTGGNG